MFGKHWSLTDDLVSIWCNAICLGLFASNVITLDLSALIRSNPKYVWNGDKEIGQRMLMISVHLVDQTGVQCYPGRGTPHMLPPDTHWPAGWLNPRVTRGCSTAAGAVHTDGHSSSYCGPGRRPVRHWTRVQDSPTVASAVTRTQILLWWNIFYVPVDEHIQRSYT